MATLTGNGASPPTEVRSYIKEVLLNLVIIHAEVYAVSEHIVPRVLCRLIELVSDEFLRYISEVEVFSYNGVLYVCLMVVRMSSLSCHLLGVDKISCGH